MLNTYLFPIYWGLLEEAARLTYKPVLWSQKNQILIEITDKKMGEVWGHENRPCLSCQSEREEDTEPAGDTGLGWPGGGWGAPLPSDPPAMAVPSWLSSRGAGAPEEELVLFTGYSENAPTASFGGNLLFCWTSQQMSAICFAFILNHMKEHVCTSQSWALRRPRQARNSCLGREATERQKQAEVSETCRITWTKSRPRHRSSASVSLTLTRSAFSVKR